MLDKSALPFAAAWTERAVPNFSPSSMLPELSGEPLRVELKNSLGPHHAATSIPRRLILLDRGVLTKPGDFERILIHEIFHFAWVRLSNETRRDWRNLLAAERDPGELGWSAEWRKLKLNPRDAREDSPKWKRYARESFCDSAAWLFAGLDQHDEFTLGLRSRRARQSWFQKHFASRPIAI